MKLQKTILSFICAVLVLFSGCTYEVPEQATAELPVVEHADFTTYNQFAINLLKTTRNTGENRIVSPFSIGMALTMMRLGAEGETAGQIETVLGMQFGNFGSIINDSLALSEQLDKLDGLLYYTGTGLFVGEGPSIIENQAVIMEDYFGLHLEFMPFGDPKALTTVNDWASQTTTGRIDELFAVDEFPADSKVLLLSASAVECQWQKGFNPEATRSMPFTLDDGKGIAFPTMRGRIEMFHYLGDDAEVGFIPLSGGNITMAILLPPEDQTIDEFLAALTAEDIERWKTMSTSGEFWCYIPRIDLVEVNSYREPITEMGAGSMFDPMTAEFGAMGNHFYLDDIYQAVQIRAIEEGEEESGYTSVDVTRAANSGEYFFNACTTMIFMIVDNQSGGILMIGSMVDPINDN